MLIGNCISFVAACFTLVSAWSRDRRSIYLFQAAQCLLLALANVFFASLSGATTLFLCAVRNLLIARERFSGGLCAFFVVSVGLLGLLANNRGAVGLLPVAATALYTVGCLYAVSPLAVKLNLMINLIAWAVYDLFILDVVSFVVDTVSVGAALLSLLRRD